MNWGITGNISDMLMALAAIVALVYAVKEYNQYVEQKKTAEEQERKHDEQEIARMQARDKEITEARNRELFLDRQKEIAHVEAYAVMLDKDAIQRYTPEDTSVNRAVLLRVPTEASIFNVQINVRWNAKNFIKSTGEKINTTGGVEEFVSKLMPGRRPWRIIAPGNWIIVPHTTKDFLWKFPQRANEGTVFSPIYAVDQKYYVTSLEFTDCYGNRWRRKYSDLPKQADTDTKIHVCPDVFELVSAKDPELEGYVTKDE